MRQITITIDQKGFHVTERGLTSDRLCWDEMLGQIAALTHPRLSTPQYSMRSPEQIISWDVKHGIFDGMRFDENGVPK